MTRFHPLTTGVGSFLQSAEEDGPDDVTKEAPIREKAFMYSGDEEHTWNSFELQEEFC